MKFRGAWLALRLARFELVALGGSLLIVSALAIVAAAYIRGLAPPAVCFEAYIDVPPVGCDAAGAAFYGAQSLFGSPLMVPLVGLPSIAALLLGVPLVARELERGTSRLAWSLTPSRTRWLVTRLVPMLVVLAAISYVAGFAADRLSGSFQPDRDLSNAFDGFGVRGGLIASRAVFVFSVAVAVGAVVGRVLPALILSAIIAAVGIAGGEIVHQQILKGEAVAIEQAAVQPGDLYVDQRFRLPDGTVVGWEYFVDSDQYDANGESIYPEVTMVVLAERYRFVEGREALALAGGSLVACLLAGVVVTRRRPT